MAPTDGDEPPDAAAALTLWWFAEGWDSVLDRDAPKAAMDMVQAATMVLRGDANYGGYRIILAQMHREKETGTEPINLELAADSTYIDDWITEVLRYLAMKVYVNGGKPIPSVPVNDALRALMLFPTTYGKVCKAMGSSSARNLDMNNWNEATSPRNPLEDELYNLTLGSYEVLFKGVAPATFWPVEDEAEVDSIAEAAPALVRCDESDVDQSYSAPASISASTSIVEKNQWNHVIQNPEAPELAIDMVQAAGMALRRDQNYDSFRTSLAAMLKEKRHVNLVFRRMKEQVKCLFSKEFCYQEKMKIIHEAFSTAGTSFIDDWIEELLRYLAMKVLIVGDPMPSMPVKDAWKALVLFPSTYGKVCKALGSPSAIDFYKGSATGEDPMLALQRNVYLYSTTMESYVVLFRAVAPATFWPTEYEEKITFCPCGGTTAPAVICIDDFDDTSTLTLS